MQPWQQNYNPLDNLWLSALIAAIPIVFFFVALAVFRIKGHITGTITVILALLVAIGFYGMPVPMALASAWLEPGQIAVAVKAGWTFWAALVFSAVVVSLGAHTIYVTLLQRYEANLISALVLVTPLATIALGVIAMRDPFGPRMLIGTLLALAGVLIIALRGNQAIAMLMALRNRS